MTLLGSVFAGHSSEHIVRNFWKWVRALTDSDRLLLLAFATGSPSVPPGGFAALGYVHFVCLTVSEFQFLSLVALFRVLTTGQTRN